MKTFINKLAIVVGITATAFGCGKTADSASTTTTTTDLNAQHVDTSLFNRTDVTSIREVTKKMSDSSYAVCYEITTKCIPPDHAMGPYCPTNNTQSVGVWVDPTLGETAVNPSYLTYLKSKGWDIVDANGNVRLCTTDDDFKKVATQELGGWTFAQAQTSGLINRCISPTAKEQTAVVYIPKYPKKAASAVLASKVNSVGLPGVSVSLNGILVFAPEPTVRIMTYQNIAPFDSYGGHIAFAFLYHYHRMWHVSNPNTKILGYAFDGYPVYANGVEPDGTTVTGLDAQQGHEYGTLGYHYHENGANVVGGLSGLYVPWQRTY